MNCKILNSGNKFWKLRKVFRNIINYGDNCDIEYLFYMSNEVSFVY